MKKIAILTMHRTTNFGSLLQTIGLYQKMKCLGADVEVLDYHCQFIEDKELISHKPIWMTVKGILYYLVYTLPVLIKEKCMERDLLRFTRLSPNDYTIDNIGLSNSRYDVFLAGSDMLWGLDITNGDYTFFLDFVKDNTKKYSFATSVGNTDKYLDDNKAAELLKQFREINVRETQAADWVKTLSGKDCDVVCDPTLLLDSYDWDKLVTPVKYSGDYLLIYFGISDQLFVEAKEYATKHNLKIKHINYYKRIRGINRVRPHSLAQFLGLVKNAKMVFTDSYHGLLFAINYNRQVRFYNRGGSSRMSFIASKLGIEKTDASICPISDIYYIDYDKVNPMLREFREYSTSKLKELIE